MNRRHLTTAITMLVLCGLLVLGVIVGVNALFAPLPDTGKAIEPESSCAPDSVSKGDRIRSKQVVVSVFNAGTRGGLADQTLSALAKRGFKEGELGNAPEDAKVRTAQVWTGRRHDAAARLVASQLGRKARVVVTDEDLGDGVDVVVGNDFRGLVKAKRSIVVRSNQAACISADAT
jgi:hypothetical protein